MAKVSNAARVFEFGQQAAASGHGQFRNSQNDHPRGAAGFPGPAKQQLFPRLWPLAEGFGKAATTEKSGMFNASSSMRLAALSLVAAALATLAAPVAYSQTIDVSLNVFYANPGNVNSGGTWEIVAKSSHAGISNLSLKLVDINMDAVNQAPRGMVNGVDGAGFSEFDQFANSIFIAQVPAFPTGGQEESAFYGVGTIANGDPGDLGPARTTLSAPQDIPWATGDIFGNAAWNTAARFASGTFDENVTPSFMAGSTGQVFSSAPASSTVFGMVDLATISTIVRTNFVPGALPGDYNNDGIVNAADYVAWRKTPSNHGGDPGGYNTWRQNFGESFGPGAGGGAAVPEPASIAMTVITLLAAGFYRRSRMSGCA